MLTGKQKKIYGVLTAVLLAAGLYGAHTFATTGGPNGSPLWAKEQHQSRLLSEEVYQKLSAEEQFMIGSHWRDAFVDETLLLEQDTMIVNENYLNQRVHRISFFIENGTSNLYHVVYVSIEDHKIVGYSLFREE